MSPASRLDLYFGGDNFGPEVQDVTLARLSDSDHVRRAPLVLEPVTSDSDCARAFFYFMDQPVGERLVEPCSLMISAGGWGGFGDSICCFGRFVSDGLQPGLSMS